MKKNHIWSIVLLVTLPFLFASCMGMARQGALANAYEAYGEGNCAEVLENLSNAEYYKTPSPELLAEMRFLRALCFEKQGRTAEALGTYRYIADQHPDTEYGYRSKEKIKELKRE